MPTYSTVRRWVINGVAVTIPLVVTIMVLSLVLNFILGVISPLVLAVAYLWPAELPRAVLQLLTLLALVGTILLVGIVADLTSGERLSRGVHTTMESIPGISTVYATVRKASDILVDDNTDQFKEVMIVEFPHDDAYMLGFLTADTPETIETATDGREMLTVVVPLGPNPTTNGFVMHVPTENVHDVDLTVEEAVRSIATLGVATDAVDDD
ncbi:DUF502 domain-containing protein [Natrononativus amylolyticus]|uniref:DUF502 domain-containing protein n=1 Tax=Natrononativus amylolyticus TaxID=2963434 RepID=UPI0020CDD397|nr:DUF502 domain-containing protein [Natrononativus amylolyticus]